MDRRNGAALFEEYLRRRVTLPEALGETLEHLPGGTFTFVDGEGTRSVLGGAAWLGAAQRALGGFRDAGLKPGDPVILQLEDGPRFVAAFWGALLGGLLPVPLSLPQAFHPRHPSVAKLAAVAERFDAPVLAVEDSWAGEYAELRRYLRASWRPLPWSALEAGPVAAPSPAAFDRPAFLMFSSGSTGQPKGVVLTHENLLHNLRQIADRSALTADDRSVSWLPYTHDMGLVLFHLAHALAGIPQLKVGPLTFMRDPVGFLRHLHDHRATLVGSPNFGFDHLLRRVPAEALAGLDLSAVRLIYNGAEPISADLCRAFVDRFARAGLRPDVISPGYGIAEACVCASQHPTGSPLSREVAPVKRLSREALLGGGTLEAPRSPADALELVNLGPPMPGMELRAIDDAGVALPEGRIGHLQLRGPNVTRAFHGTPPESDPRLFAGGWVGTGDLGFLEDGCVFITGRAKDVIFINGQNAYAHDVEAVLEREGGVPLGQVAVVGYRSPDLREERVALFLQGGRPDEARLTLLAKLRGLVWRHLGFPVHDLLLLPLLPRTSSGKLQRADLQARLERGELTAASRRIDSLLRALRLAEPPATPLEERLLAALPGAEARGVTASFLELAGDSLAVVALFDRLSAAIPEVAGLGLAGLLGAEHVRGLAQRLEAGASTRVRPTARGLSRHPLSAGQRDLYFLHRLDGGRAYHEAYTVALEGELDAARFRQALALVVRRHAALRTRIESSADGPVQGVSDATMPSLAFEDLSTFSDPYGLAQARARALAEAPFALDGDGGLARFALYRTGAKSHVLALCLHHLVIDGWGLARVLDDLDHACAGTLPPESAAPRLQSLDAYAHLAQQQGGEAWEAAKRHWRTLFATFPPEQQWEGGADEGPAVAVHEERLSATEVEALHAAARALGATPFQAALACYLLALAQGGQGADLAVGLTVHGRPEPELLDVVGYLANTLAIRVSLADARTVGDLVALVARQAGACLAHPQFPVSAFVRAPGEAPAALYGAAFSMIPSPLPRGAGSLRWRSPERLRLAPKLPLLLNVEVEGDGWRLVWERDARRIGAVQQEALVAGFRDGLRALSRGPTTLINRTRLLDVGARAAVEALAVAPRLEVPFARITDAFEAQAARAPEREALRWDGGSLSYAALRSPMDRLALAVSAAGARPGTRVLVLLPKGPAMAASALGVLKAGAAYVPIDVEYPEDRIRSIAAIASARVALAAPAFHPLLKAAGVTTVIDPETLAWSGPDVAPPCPALPEDPAYLHFTSGSTGEPKGIQNSHASVCHLIAWYLRDGLYRADDRIPQLVSFAFEAFVGELFPTLAAGAALVLFPPLREVSADEARERFSRERITVATLTPSYALQLLRRGADGPPFHLRTLVFGGEALLPAHIDALRAGLGPTTELINAYGPTEATVHATWWKVPPGKVDEVRIGRALPGKRVVLVDPAGRLCPPGMPGEIWIGGQGLADGYLGDPAKTARAFVQYELAPERPERCYRTGDLAQLTPDGELLFLGRVDHQVKIAGQRVELEEVERAVLKQEGVREAAVVAEEYRPGQRRLVACYVGTATPETLAAALRTALPSYAVPSRFLALPRLPTSANAKVDRKALLEQLRAEAAAQAAHVTQTPTSTRSTMEELTRAVVGAWETVLRAPLAQPGASFFSAGGDSILALELVAVLAERGHRLTPQEVFQHPTVAAQATILAQRAPAAAPAEDEEPAETQSGAVALTPIQQWFFDRGLEHPEGFVQAAELELARAPEPAHLQEALAALTAAHPQLRAVFRIRRQGVQQVVLERGQAVPVLRQVEGTDDALPALRIAAQAELELGKRVQAAALLRRPDGSGRLVWVVHHLVMDTVSWRVLAQDLVRALAQRAAGEAVKLPHRSASYRLFADRLLAEADAEGAWAREAAHWRPLLEGKGALGQLAAEPASRRTADFEVATAALSAEATEQLRALIAERTGPHLQDAAFAAAFRALAGWAGKARFAVDLEHHGRGAWDGLDLSRTVGWCTSLFPVLVEASAKESPLEGLLRTHRALGKVPRDGAGFGLLRYLSGDEAAQAAFDGYRDAQAVVQFFGGAGRLDLGGGSKLVPSEVAPVDPRNTAPYALVLTLVLEEGRLTASVASARGFAGQSAAALAVRVVEELEALARALAEVKGAFLPFGTELSLAEARKLPADTEALVPMTPMQESLVFHTLEQQASALYHEQTLYRCRRPLDPAVVQAAYSLMCRRHELLRAQFSVSGAPQVVILRSLQPRLQVQALTGAVDGTVPAEVEAFMARERADHRFDPREAPLHRLTLFQGGSGCYLLFSFHHALLDGWSQATFMNELYEACQAIAAGKTPPLDPPRSRFVDYSNAVRAAAARPESRAFWLKAAGDPPVLELPVDHLKPAVRTVTGRKAHRELPVADVAALEALARARGATFNAVCLASLWHLLHVLTGEDEVCTGMVVTGRGPELPDSHRMMGCLLNTVPARAAFDPATVTFGQLIDQAQAFLGEAKAHEAFPLKDIVRAVAQARPGRGARDLFSTLYAFENYPDQSGATAEFELVDGYDLTNYDLAMVLVKRGSSLRLMFEYPPDAVEDATAQRWLEQLSVSMGRLARAPEAPVATVDVLADSQKRLWALYNQTERNYHLDQTLPELFEAQAARTPDAVAITDGKSRLTYRELDQLSGRLARYLVSRGLGAGQLAAIAHPRRPEALAGLLAIMKAGAAYVPIDPGHPPERIAMLLRSAAVGFVLTDSATLAAGAFTPSALGVEAVLLDGGEHPAATPRATWIAQEAGPLGRRCAPDALGYLIYTSGSTGVPKGVMIRHRSAVNTLLAMNELFGVVAADRVLCFSSFCFDLSVYDLFGSLACGATVVLADEQAIRDPEALFALLAQERVTVWDSVPTGMNQLLQTLALAGGQPRNEQLRLVFLSGEFIPLNLPADIKRVFPAAQPISLGGATEGTVWSIFHPIHHVRAALKSIPYGKPLPNQGYYVLNDALRLCPVDQPGMLYITGEGVAAGYHGDATKTAASFIADPLRGPDAPKIYRTGDLGRMRGDGNLEILGRKDDQVKVRGFRVELGEIENQLGKAPGVGEAAVLARKEDGHTRLIAFYTSASAGLGAEELVAFLKTRLPEYMVPTQFQRIERMPVNSNGKLDRKALRSIETEDRSAIATEFVAPAGPLQTLIAETWAKVLKVEQVGANDNYFVLGGDSILSLQVAARLAEAGHPVRGGDIFRHPTVAGLATHIETRATADAAISVGPARYPPSPIQRWFLEQRLERPDGWHLSMELDVPEALDPARLARAAQEVAAAHGALRARLVKDGEAWVVEELPALPALTVAFEDGAALTPVRRNEALAAFARKLREEIRLDQAPLFRLGVFRVAADRTRLVWAMHHLIADGVSWRVLLEELQRAYRDGGAAIPPERASYGAWVLALAAAVEAEDASAALEPFGEGSAPPLFDVAPGSEEAAAVAEGRLEATTTQALLQRGNVAYGNTVQEVVTAAAAIALAGATGHVDLGLELEHHGRDWGADGLDLSRTVGWFTAISPLRFRLEGEADLRGALVQAKDGLRASQELSTAHLALRMAGRVPEHRPAQVLFNYLGDLDRLALADGWRMAEQSWPDRDGANHRTHALDVTAWLQEGRLAFRWRGPSSLEPAELAARFARALEALVAHASNPAHARKTRADFPLLRIDDAQVRRLEALGAETAYPLSPMQEGMIFQQQLHPGLPMYHVEASALLGGELRLELLEEAVNRIARLHEPLRTVILSAGFARPVAAVLREVRYQIELHRGISVEEGFQRLRRSCADPERPPNLGFLVIEVEQGAFRLLQFFHHWVIDGWSNAQLFTRIMEEYEALVAARGAGLPALPQPAVPYSAYITQIEAKRRDLAARAFWRQELAGLPARPLELLPGRASPGPRSFRTRILMRGLSVPLSEALKAQAKALKCTISDLLVTGCAALAHLLSGERDLVLGFSASVRPASIPGNQTLIGMFLHTLPLRLRVDGPATFESLLAEVRARLERLRQHEDFPLTEIQRSLPRPVELRVLYTSETYPGARLAGGFEARGFDNWHQTEFDLALVYSGEGPDGIALKLAAADDLISEPLLDAWLARYQSLLGALCASPASPLAAPLEAGLGLASASTPAPTFAARFEQAAAQHAALPALELPDGTQVDYAELERSTRALAAALTGPRRVLIDAGASELFRTRALLACLRAGRAFVPADPRWTPAQLAAVLAEADIRHVATDRPTAWDGVLPEGVTALAAHGAIAPDALPACSPETEAYVCYTSGTSGASDHGAGVRIGQRALARFLERYGAEVALAPGDRTPALLPQAFDARLSELLPALCAGATVILGHDLETPGPGGLASVAARERWTFLTLPAAYFALWAELLAAAPVQGLGALRAVAVGGSPLGLDAVARWQAATLAGGRLVPLLNVYGLTEAAVASSVFRVDRPLAELGLDPELPSLPIGKVGPSLQVVDGALAAATEGELVLTGDQRHLGTLDHAAPGAWLRTGDLARVDREGRVVVLGRRDRQVKVRGRRLHLDALERRLCSVPGVVAAAVVVGPGIGSPEAGPHLVAFCVDRQERPRAALTEAVDRAGLADLALELRSLPRLPLSDRGKPDLRHLESLAARPEVGAAVETASALEALRAALARVLGRPLTVSDLDADFRSLGGDSLLALGARVHLSRAVGREPTLEQLLNAPSLRALGDGLLHAAAARPPEENA